MPKKNTAPTNQISPRSGQRKFPLLSGHGQRVRGAAGQGRRGMLKAEASKFKGLTARVAVKKHLEIQGEVFLHFPLHLPLSVCLFSLYFPGSLSPVGPLFSHLGIPRVVRIGSMHLVLKGWPWTRSRQHLGSC